MDGRLLSATEAAKRLDTSVSNVKRWCRERRLIGAQKVGERIWAIPERALDGFTRPKPGPKVRGCD